MNNLIEHALYEYTKDKNHKDMCIQKQNEKDLKNIKKYLKKCFGNYAETDIVPTELPNKFRIKDSDWDLVRPLNSPYELPCGFVLMHKDPTKNNNYSTFFVEDLLSLGKALKNLMEQNTNE